MLETARIGNQAISKLTIWYDIRLPRGLEKYQPSPQLRSFTDQTREQTGTPAYAPKRTRGRKPGRVQSNSQNQGKDRLESKVWELTRKMDLIRILFKAGLLGRSAN